jgi:hypothetical protein
MRLLGTLRFRVLCGYLPRACKRGGGELPGPLAGHGLVCPQHPGALLRKQLRRKDVRLRPGALPASLRSAAALPLHCLTAPPIACPDQPNCLRVARASMLPAAFRLRRALAFEDIR